MAEFEPVLTRNWNVPDSHTLAVYESRGGYQASRKALTTMTPDAGRRAGQGLGAARPRRGGLPLRAEVDVPAEGPSRPDLPVRQRRRERAGHVQQPHPDGAGPASGARRDHASPATPPGRTTAYIYLRYEYGRALPRAASRRSTSATPAGLLGQEHPRQRLRPRHLPAPRGRGVHLRRRDRADRKPGRQAGLAADQAAVPGRRRGVPQADGRQQRRDAGCVTHIVDRGVDWFKSIGVPPDPKNPRRRQLRAEAVLHQRPRQQAGLRRAAAGRHRAAS